MKPLVTRKMTARFFVRIRGRNKGFPNETAAWKALAKAELGQIIHSRAVAIAKAEGIDTFYLGTQTRHVYQAYAEMFPHPADGSCAKNYPRTSFCTWHSDGGDLHPYYAWCKTAYRAWIEEKVRELKGVRDNSKDV